MMSIPKISVIVPIYNAEKHLNRCVSSILSQTFVDLELLLIDDGSRDNSKKICDEYAEKDSRVRVFHKLNEGVSSARNLGLDNVHGEWIIFIDADDYWIEDTALKHLYDFAKTNDLDVARGEYISVDIDGNRIEIKDYTSKLTFERKLLSGNSFLKNVVCGEFFLVLCLIKRNAIVGLRFDENQFFLEDMKFYMQMLLRKQRCGYVQYYFYAYRKIAGSASRTFKIHNLKDSLGMCDFFWNMAETTDDGDLSKICRYYSVMMYCWSLQRLANSVSFAHFEDIASVLNLNELYKHTCQRSRHNDVKLNPKVKVILTLTPKYSTYLLKIRALIVHFCKICKNMVPILVFFYKY